MTRGEEEGISGEKGEGFVGTNIKETWTIRWGGGGAVRNRREVGRAGIRLGWGEKSENCT